MEQFEVGVWYDFRDQGSDYQIAACFLSESGGYFYYDEAINNREGYYKSKGGNWYIPKIVKKFPLEELYKYLPHLKPVYELY